MTDVGLTDSVTFQNDAEKHPRAADVLWIHKVEIHKVEGTFKYLVTGYGHVYYAHIISGYQSVIVHTRVPLPGNQVLIKSTLDFVNLDFVKHIRCTRVLFSAVFET